MVKVKSIISFCINAIVFVVVISWIGISIMITESMDKPENVDRQTAQGLGEYL